MSLKGKRGFLLLAAAIVGLDQLSKYLVRDALHLYATRTVIPGFCNLTHIRNPGAVWGFFSQHSDGVVPKLITLLALAAIGGVVYYFIRINADCRLELTAFSFILGGAFGNIIDRLARGYVTDFIHLYVKNLSWPIFNVSDSFITVGVLLLTWAIWRGKCTQF